MTDRPAQPPPVPPPGRPATARARADVVAARAAVDAQLGALEVTARDALNPANLIRHNAGKLAAGAGAAGFVALGGPSRLIRGAGRALRGGRKPTVKQLLPKEIDEAVSGLGPDAPAVRGKLERAFAEYLRGRKTDAPSPGRSLWRFVDAVSVPVGQRVVKEAVARFLAGEGAEKPRS